MSVVTTLFRHNRWANLKLLEACAGLSAAQLAAEMTGGYGSISETLQHIVKGELGYVKRVNGAQPPQPLPADGFAGIERLQAAARWTGDELLQLALSTRAAALVVEPPHPTYPLASLMMQAITHATEHRTQITATLTQLGIEPPDLSGWAYMDEHGEIKPPDTAAEVA
jgi:uncharacterized damage-inducible protein DinB